MTFSMTLHVAADGIISFFLKQAPVTLDLGESLLFSLVEASSPWNRDF